MQINKTNKQQRNANQHTKQINSKATTTQTATINSLITNNINRI